ncbi:MAG: hypothetical protein JOZ22_01770 [Acidobacteriia bacterium]|nr:hypothetical protein [Terriglobia bacterium]
MEELTAPSGAEAADTLEVGALLGKNHAFGLIAGRCSAAQAESLSRLRREQKYKRITPHWRDFCSQYLKMSQTQVDHVIGLWEEFGAAYFEVAQLTRISAEAYRALAPSIRDGALEDSGETIELNEQNAQRVAAAVARLRRALPPKAPKGSEPPLTSRERLAEMDKRWKAALAAFQEVATTERDSESQALLQLTLARIREELARIALENGLE